MGDVKNFRFKTSQGNYDIPVKDTTARERIGDLEQLQTPHKDNLVNAINDLEGGGSGGTSNYNELNNKPSVNGVTLVGNKTTEDLGVEIITDYDDLENRPVESGDLDIDAVVYPLPEDLTEYVTESEFTETLSNYTNTTDLTTLLNAKQDTLTFDNVPTQSSNNPVKSGGVYSALSDKADASDVEDIEALIPSTATVSNKLATMDDIGGVIDDTSTSTDTTWSSSKINNELNGESQTDISLTFGGQTAQSTIHRYGNTCELNLYFTDIDLSQATQAQQIITILPNEYKPKFNSNRIILAQSTTSSYFGATTTPLDVNMLTSGEIIILINTTNKGSIKKINCSISWVI